MATEVINSYNIYVDTERYLNGTSTGDSIMLSLNQTPITCSDNQYIRLTLQSFSMYKSFTNVNTNNNIFRLTTVGGTAPVPVTDAPFFIPSSDYADKNSLGLEFATLLSNALATASGVALAAVPIPITGTDALTPPTSGNTDGIITFRIDFAAAHNLTTVLVRTLIVDGDSFEVLGTNRIRADDGTAAWDLLNSLTVDLAPASAPVPANSIMVSCPYNCQLSTQQNVYLRTDVNNTNIQTESFNSENTDVLGANNLSSSRILARMIVDNDFVNFTTGTQMEYFVNLNTRQLTFLRLFITDSHGRPIPQNVQRVLAGATGNDPLIPPIEQLTLGNRSWEACIKVDIVQYMGGQNGVLQSELPVPTVPARFGTEPLNKLKYGASGYPDPAWNRANNVVGY
tara:strand:+ start:225 stop:1418 length:1194 start_codon:yes stop_codon:yes gene_type:complete